MLQGMATLDWDSHDGWGHVFLPEVDTLKNIYPIDVQRLAE